MPAHFEAFPGVRCMQLVIIYFMYEYFDSSRSKNQGSGRFIVFLVTRYPITSSFSLHLFAFLQLPRPPPPLFRLLPFRLLLSHWTPLLPTCPQTLLPLRFSSAHTWPWRWEPSSHASSLSTFSSRQSLAKLDVKVVSMPSKFETVILS